MQTLNIDNIVQRPFWSLVYSVAYPCAEPEPGEALPRLWLIVRALFFLMIGSWCALVIVCVAAIAALLGRYPAVMGSSDGYLFSRYWLPHIRGFRLLPMYLMPLVILLVWPQTIFSPENSQEARVIIGGVLVLVALAGSIAALVRMANSTPGTGSATDK